LDTTWILVTFSLIHFVGLSVGLSRRIYTVEYTEVYRRIVTFLIIAPYKYSYLLTYLSALYA